MKKPIKSKYNTRIYLDKGIYDGVLEKHIGLDPNSLRAGARLQREHKAYEAGVDLAKGENAGIYYKAYKNNENLLYVAVEIGDVDTVDYRMSWTINGIHAVEDLN